MEQLISIGFQGNTHIPSHHHSLWEIVYYVQGHVRLTVGDRILVCEPGSLVFLPPGIPHAEDCEEGYANYFFVVGRFGLPVRQATAVRDLADRPMQQILSQMLYLFHTRSSKWQRTLASLLDVLAHYATGLLDQPARQPLVGQFINTLVDNIGNEGFRLEVAMSALPMSEDHLRILFTRETGQSPLQYLTDLRIRHACSLMLADLDNHALTIQSVSRQCGYSDPYYFSRVFRKKVGLSPRQWLDREKERLQSGDAGDPRDTGDADAAVPPAVPPAAAPRRVAPAAV